MAALVLTALSISPVFKDSDQGISNAIFNTSSRERRRHVSDLQLILMFN